MSDPHPSPLIPAPPREAQQDIRLLAGVMKKLLPAPLLAEVLTYLDPLGTFEAALHASEAGPREESVVPNIAVPQAHRKAASRFNQMFRNVPLTAAEKSPDPDFEAGPREQINRPRDRRWTTEHLAEVAIRRASQGCEGSDEQGCFRDDAVIPLEDLCDPCLIDALRARMEELAEAGPQAPREEPGAMSVYRCDRCGRFYSSPLPEGSACQNHIPEHNARLTASIKKFNERLAAGVSARVPEEPHA